jgi:hypothetical protein
MVTGMNSNEMISLHITYELDRDLTNPHKFYALRLAFFKELFNPFMSYESQLNMAYCK